MAVSRTIPHLLTTTLLAFLTSPLSAISFTAYLPSAQAESPATLKPEADRLVQQAEQYLKAGQSALAISHYEQALKLYRAAGDSAGMKKAQFALTILYGQWGAGGNILATGVMGMDPAAEYGVLSHADRKTLDALHQAIGEQMAQQYGQAAATLQRAIAANPSIQHAKLAAEVWAVLGVAQLHLANYTQSITSLQTALTALQTIQVTDPHVFLTVDYLLRAIGEVHFQQGNYPQAIAHFQQSWAAAQARFAKLSPKQLAELNMAEKQTDLVEATFLLNLGKVYLSMGDYAQAMDHAQRALAKERAAFNRPHANAILTPDQQAQLPPVDESNDQFSMGNDSNVDANVRERALGLLGEALFRAGRLPEAEKVLARALQDLDGARRREINMAATRTGSTAMIMGLDLEDQTKAAKRLQLVLVAQGKLNQALEVSEKGRARAFAELVSQRLVTATKPNGESDPTTQSRPLMPSLGDLGNMPAPEQVPDQVAAMMSPQLCQTLADQVAEMQGDRDMAQAQQILQQQISQCREAMANSQQAISQERLKDFMRQMQANPTVMDYSTATVMQQQDSQPIAAPNLAQIQAVARQRKATLVEYAVVPDSSFGKLQTNSFQVLIWVVQPNGTTSFRRVDTDTIKLAIKEQSLQQLVRSTRDIMGVRGRTSSEFAFNPAAIAPPASPQLIQLRQLHQLLIDPIADLLPKTPTETVVFIPQDELFLVPFAALQDGNGQTLLERHTIVTAPSIQVLQLTQQLRQQVTASQPGALLRGKAVIVGNPTMPKLRTSSGGWEQLSSLAGAETEAQAIAQLLNRSAIIGSQARKSVVMQQMADAQLIHLATHGLLDDVQRLGVPGAIALAPDGNRLDTDGFLTASEILEMKLKAELVVLSACDTGRGKITGDGVVGLSRSLITAGVPSLVVSLWKVPDDSTSFLMTQFYKNLQTTSDKAQALRQAMLATKEQFADPIHWAAFTLIGES